MKSFVLAEKLKNELEGQKVLAAVFHTFNFDPFFFENYLLPIFLPDVPFSDNPIQNTILWRKFQDELPPITVYCDFHAKGQKGVNLSYDVRTIDVPKAERKPCYHPKHSYILREDYTMLVFIGSNNLTEGGWCSNLEGVCFFSLKNKKYFPRTLKDQFKHFHREIVYSYFNDEYTDADEGIDRFFRSTGYKGSSKAWFYDNSQRLRDKDENIISDNNLLEQNRFAFFIRQIREHRNNNLPFKCVEVISPYYPTSISLFNELKDVTGSNDISFSIPFEVSDVVRMEKDLFNEIGQAFKWKAIRHENQHKGFQNSHAKIYRFVGEQQVFTIVGSVNFTNMAWKGVSNGGNHETALLFSESDMGAESLLKEHPLENLSFIGNQEVEGIPDNREDVYNLTFKIDWIENTLEIINPKRKEQKGHIVFDNGPNIDIDKSAMVSLNEEQIELLSTTPLIKVRPENLNTFFYYYPVHINIESKPLPANINLSDHELLELWLELDIDSDKETMTRILDKFFDRITDESGDIKEDQIFNTNSTLNVMASHLNGLMTLRNKIFKQAINQRDVIKRQKIKAYYLLTNNVDTLIGYRKLLKKMANDGRINKGFNWLLLEIINKHFYGPLKVKDFADGEIFNKSKIIQMDVLNEIREVVNSMKGSRITNKHLDWVSKILKDEVV